MMPASTRSGSRPMSRSAPGAAPSGGPTSSRCARAGRSATRCGPTGGASTRPATASGASPSSKPCATSSRPSAAASTASAGRTGSITGPAPRRASPSPVDVAIGTGDGATAVFQLVKIYGAGLPTPYTRADRASPCAGTRAGGGERRRGRGTAGRCDATTGLVTFAAGHVRPPAPPSRPASSSTCRCASTPTTSRPTSPSSRPGRSPTSPSWRSGLEDAACRPSRPGSPPGVTTLAYCWRLTRRDGAVLGFTEHDRDLVDAGTDLRGRHGLHGLADRAVARACRSTTWTAAGALLVGRASPRPTSWPAATTTRPSSCSGSTGPIPTRASRSRVRQPRRGQAAGARLLGRVALAGATG